MIRRCVPARRLLLPGVVAIAIAGRAAAQFVESDVSLIHEWVGEAPGDGLGWAVAVLSDVSGDGIPELIVPAPFNDAGASNAGRVYVYSGATGMALPGLTLTAGSANANLGYSIADAGDVNGDGVADVIAGLPQVGTTGAGSVRIYSGATGMLIRAIAGQASGDAFGYSVAGAGDVNGDGRADVLVGAPFHDTAGASAGRAYVYSATNGVRLHSWDGEAAGDRLGSGIASVGDLNGDGIPEHVVGAPAAGPGAVGRAYVYDGSTHLAAFPPLQAEPTGGAFGEFFVGPAGDSNADGVPDVYVGDYADSACYVFSGIDGQRLHFIEGDLSEGLGCGRAAGDVNNDGYDDLAVGAYLNSDGAPQAGRVYLFSGRDGSTLRTITSTRAGENSGFDAIGAGDLNGDGWIDVLVGAAGPGGNRAYVVAGVPLWQPGDMNCDGQLNVLDINAFVLALSDPGGYSGQYPECELLNGDLDGNGGVDVLDINPFVAALAGQATR
ncbi:FG-GAP repeat protein [Phycisphaerae bacterium RAS1]|nr:FG-GAP repeat protein [Phycisphaerae bacterium RAS1]